MRLLFGILLLLCIAFFSYMQWGGALTGTAKNGQSLAELNSEKIILLDKPVAKQIPGSAVVPAQPAIVVSAPVAVPAPAPAAVAVPASAPIPAPVAAPAAAIALPGKAIAVKTCMEWGEFSGDDLARSEKELARFKLADRLAQRTVEYASGYWVYMPPLGSKEAVNKKIAAIKALGLEDYYVVKDSRQWYNAISFGVFKTEEAAKKYLAVIRKKGIRTARVGERKHKLKFIVYVIKNVDTELNTRLTALQKDFAGSELKSVPCSK